MSDKILNSPALIDARPLKTADDVIEFVAEAFNCTYGEIVGDIRTNALAKARRMTVAIMRTMNIGSEQSAIHLNVTSQSVGIWVRKFFKQDFKDDNVFKLWLSVVPKDFHTIRTGEALFKKTGEIPKFLGTGLPAIEGDPVSFEDMSRIGSEKLAVAIGRYFKKYHSA